MIRFDEHERAADALHRAFASNRPFPHLIIDDFVDAPRLDRALSAIPAPEGEINKSRDYIFAKNKYEKSEFAGLSPDLAELRDDLLSPRFQAFLQKVTGEKVFVDPEFFGGGIHQGGADSFLDMHADFNYHPIHKNWFRNLNILLYLNKDWKPEYRGQLKLRHAQTGEAAEVEPLFNRCVIMFTREFTLHGYDRITFPPDTYRRSLASYAYTLHDQHQQDSYRSTKWAPENGSAMKKAIGASWPLLVRIKNFFFGVGTVKNR